jgi:N-formylglutamate amidohydrolase
MTLPIAISVPHAGIRVPPEAAPYCQLTRQQIIKDGDEYADELFDLDDEVAKFITTDVPRAIVDLNRAPDNRQTDGVVKTRTIWNEAIYRQPLPEEVISRLLEQYYHPYHRRLSQFPTPGLLFAVDCHTMAAAGPPIGPDPDAQRPEICLGNVHNRSFPEAWTTILQRSFQDAFVGYRVTLNVPFAGGYITRTHGREMPWVQLEVSRSQFLPNALVKQRIITALSAACQALAIM